MRHVDIVGRLYNLLWLQDTRLCLCVIIFASQTTVLSAAVIVSVCSDPKCMLELMNVHQLGHYRGESVP